MTIVRSEESKRVQAAADREYDLIQEEKRMDSLTEEKIQMLRDAGVSEAEIEQASWPRISREEECYRRGFRQGAYAVESGGTTAAEAYKWGQSNDPREAPGTPWTLSRETKTSL